MTWSLLGRWASIETMTEPASGSELRNIRAIALDTNIFHPTFVYSTLEVLANRAKESGPIEIWIADTVVWELAEHLVADYNKFRSAGNRLHRAGLLLESIASKTSADFALELQAMIRGIGPHVVLLSTEQFAHEALRDQILLSGPGKRKGDVKTGAADSAQLRAYAEEAKKKGFEYVVVSADKDVANAFNLWNNAAPQRIFSSLNSAENAVFRAIAASAEVLRKILQVAKSTETLLTDLVVDEANLGHNNRFVPKDLRSMSFDISPDSARFIGICDAKESATGLTFTAFYLATVSVSGFVQSSWYWSENLPDEVVSHNALLRINVTISTSSDGMTTAVVTNCSLDLDNSECTDPADALGSVFEALELVPGVVKPINRDGWTPTDQSGEKFTLTIDIGGHPLELERYGKESEQWELHASYGGDDVGLAVECMQASYNEHEDYGEPSAYLLVGSSRAGTTSDHPEYFINEMILNTVFELNNLPGNQ